MQYCWASLQSVCCLLRVPCNRDRHVSAGRSCPVLSDLCKRPRNGTVSNIFKQKVFGPMLNHDSPRINLEASPAHAQRCPGWQDPFGNRGRTSHKWPSWYDHHPLGWIKSQHPKWPAYTPSASWADSQQPSLPGYVQVHPLSNCLDMRWPPKILNTLIYSEECRSRWCMIKPWRITQSDPALAVSNSA